MITPGWRSTLPASSEILGILGHNHPIFRDGAREDDVVGIAQSAAIPGMDRVMQALIEMPAQRR